MKRLGLTAFCAAMLVVPLAMAQPPAPTGPEIKTEMGKIDGVQFRIDMPGKWDKCLIVSNHGYSPQPRNPASGAPSARTKMLAERGCAVAASAYSKGGWALEQAMDDNQKLIRYFQRNYGRPAEIYAMGGAMGAATTMTSVEKYPNIYSGGLVTCCGTMAPSSWEAMNGSFRMMALFDYYFPGVLPSPVGPIDGFMYGGATDAKVEAAFKANPEKAEIFRRTTGRRMEHLANHVTFQTFISHEMQERAGGNPFDNSTYIYTLDDDLAKVNAGVKRYVADPKAQAYAQAWYSPHGTPKKPLFIMSPVYDPVVTINNTAGYMDVVRKNGGLSKVVFQWYDHEGHGGVSEGEVASAFDALRAWAKGGPKPPTGKGVTIGTARGGMTVGGGAPAAGRAPARAGTQ